jgi:hypothetical protein
MTPQEALAKLAKESPTDFDDEADGWFAWTVDTEHPETGALQVTWEPAVDADDGSCVPGPAQVFTWDLRLVTAEPAPAAEVTPDYPKATLGGF